MRFFRFASLTLALLPLSVGCQPAGDSAPTSQSTVDEHAHEHVEIKSFAEGIEQLGKFRDEIKAAFEKGSPGDAHDALHEIGEIIEALPGLAAKQGELDQATTDAIESAKESLMDAFTKLDGVMHGGEAVEYSTVGPDIQTAMDTLKGYVK